MDMGGFVGCFLISGALFEAFNKNLYPREGLLACLFRTFV